VPTENTEYTEENQRSVYSVCSVGNRIEAGKFHESDPPSPPPVPAIFTRPVAFVVNPP